MKDIIAKARISAVQKPLNDIKLDHLANWRTKTDARIFINKLDVVFSFALLRELLEDELDKVCILTDASEDHQTKI